MTTATHFIPQSAAATTNHPAATTVPHANTSTTILNIVSTVHTITMTAINIILSEAKDPSPVMPDPIGHPQTSSHLQ